MDPITQEVIAWHIVYLWMNSHRVIWMDERPRGFVAHHLPGKNPLLAEFAAKHKLPPEIARGGEHTM